MVPRPVIFGGDLVLGIWFWELVLLILIRSNQTPVSMRRGAGLASAEFAFLSRFGATGGASNRQSLIFFGLHSRIMNRPQETGWSILISSPIYFR